MTALASLSLPLVTLLVASPAISDLRVPDRPSGHRCRRPPAELDPQCHIRQET